MAVGNTFGATALSSYGGFWLSFAVILTPGGFDIVSGLEAVSATAFYDEFGLYLMVSQPYFLFYFWLSAYHIFRAGSSSPPYYSSAPCAQLSPSSLSSSLWTWPSCSSVSAIYIVMPPVRRTHLSSRRAASSRCSRHSWLGTTLWLVLPTTRTGKSSSQSIKPRNTD